MRTLLLSLLLACNTGSGAQKGDPTDSGAACADADADGVCDGTDVCASGDDTLDEDGDGVPDACDECAGGDDDLDEDGDGVCDALDRCDGGNDALDDDGDAVPDACDACPGGDDALDEDADTVPDACDACPGGDDALDEDADTVPDACDTCPEGDDTVDRDGDAIPDDCDACPEGDNVTDSDGDGIPDGCDSCPNGDPGTFQWVTWDTPISGDTVTGSVGDTGVRYTSSSPIQTTAAVYAHGRFPASYAVPNVNPTIQNSVITDNLLAFDRPVVDPVLVFASIGNPGTPVRITFSAPISVQWSRDLTAILTDAVTGAEGYAVITVPGVHEEIEFSYEDTEHYANFVFGFAGTTEDIDGDGQADFCDPCPEDPDDACE